MTIKQFIPAPSNDEDCRISSKKMMVDVVANLGGDPAGADEIWGGLQALRGRVENPRRRIGGPVTRLGGDLLFPPVHYIRSDGE